MACVALIVEDAANRLTLRGLLSAAGHEVVEDAAAACAQVAVTDDMAAGGQLAKRVPVLVLASAASVSEAVAAMRKGVFGYIFVPLQPGEAELMVERAVGAGTGAAAAPRTESAPKSLAEMEEEHIRAVLRHCKYNRAKAARVLGIGRNTLWRKLKRMGLD